MIEIAGGILLAILIIILLPFLIPILGVILVFVILAIFVFGLFYAFITYPEISKAHAVNFGILILIVALISFIDGKFKLKPPPENKDLESKNDK